jgi:hypothetical protein
MNDLFMAAAQICQTTSHRHGQKEIISANGHQCRRLPPLVGAQALSQLARHAPDGQNVSLA